MDKQVCLLIRRGDRMSKIIIYDNEKMLIAELDRTDTKREVEYYRSFDQTANKVIKSEHSAIFYDFKVIHSNSLRKQLKKLEKILKYHKEKKKL